MGTLSFVSSSDSMSSQLKTSLAKLAGESKAWNERIKTLPDRKPIPAQTGIGKPPAATSGATAGGGIASPLTETSYADRQYHDEVTWQTTDGLFVVVVKPIKKLKFTDANGAAVEMILKQPT